MTNSEKLGLLKQLSTAAWDAVASDNADQEVGYWRGIMVAVETILDDNVEEAQ